METDLRTQVPVAEVAFPELMAVRCSAWARRTAHTCRGGGASGGSASTCRAASPPSGSGPKARRSNLVPPTCAIACSLREGQFRKSKKKRCFLPLPKCRTPTFAICHQFNSKNRRLGPTAEDSFLDETYLVDRKTTIREYLAANPHIMTTLPPPDLQERYGG